MNASAKRKPGARKVSELVASGQLHQHADEAIAVNPNRSLEKLAKQRGWAIEDWSR